LTNYEGEIVFTTASEAPKKSNKSIIYEEIFDKDPVVVKGMIFQMLISELDKNELIIGIDPGERIGLSVLYFEKEIERSIFTSVEQLVTHISEILAELKAQKKIIKIGNGNLNLARKIINLLNLRFCSHFEIEFVDERKTSLKVKNYNQRGKRDMMSAKYISHREGFRQFVLPLSRTG